MLQVLWLGKIKTISRKEGSPTVSQDLSCTQSTLLLEYARIFMSSASNFYDVQVLFSIWATTFMLLFSYIQLPVSLSYEHHLFWYRDEAACCCSQIDSKIILCFSPLFSSTLQDKLSEATWGISVHLQNFSASHLLQGHPGERAGEVWESPIWLCQLWCTSLWQTHNSTRGTGKKWM